MIREVRFGTQIGPSTPISGPKKEAEIVKFGCVMLKLYFLKVGFAHEEVEKAKKDF